jgi:hypothetical protein
MEDAKALPASVDRVRPWIAGALGMLMPGAGHAYLGLRGRAAVYSGCTLAMFALGVFYGARLYFQVGFDDPLAIIRSAAQVAMGAPYLAGKIVGVAQDAALITRQTYEYGTTFTEVAGLLNILIALDAFDVAAGRKK